MYRHGHAKAGKLTAEYVAFGNMWSRCRNPKNVMYHRYGGRGIRVCREWRTFANFIRDMGRKPSPKHMLDRIDNNRGYSKGNCRWATRQQQNENRCSVRRITFRGETHSITEWARRLGIRKTTMEGRFRRGWPSRLALTVPVGVIARGRTSPSLEECVRSSRSKA